MNLTNALKKISLGNSLKGVGLVGAGSKQTVAVELGEKQVKWILGSELSGSQMVMEQVRIKQFETASDEEISGFVKSCFDEFKLSDRRAVCSLPASAFISKNVDMPSNDPEEIRKIVTLHAGRYTPYAREEIVIDYLMVQSPEQHYTNVLLVIVNRIATNRIFKIFDLAGVYLEKILISSEAMSHVYDMWMGQGGSGESALCGIHLDYDSTEISIADRRQMVFVRSIPLGAKHLQKSQPAAMTEFFNQVRQSFGTYQDQGIGRHVERVVLTGLLVGDTGFEAEMRSLMARVSISNVQFKAVAYPDCFQVSEKVKRYLESEAQGSFFDLFSVLAMKPLLKVNLIPDEVKLQRKVREGGKDIINLGILIMSCLLLICSFLAGKIYLKNVRYKKVVELEQSTAAEARSLENASTKTRVLWELLGTRGKGLYVFDKMSGMISDDIYLSAFTYDKSGAVSLTGTADSMSRVYAFVTQLEDSMFFKNVETKQTKTRKEQGKEVADFEITCAFAEMDK